VVARRSDYVASALAAWAEPGGGTAIGHGRTLSAAGAAFANGTAAHGEDFDDTFEGGPVHAGAVGGPGGLAAAGPEGVSGRAGAGRAGGSRAGRAQRRGGAAGYRRWRREHLPLEPGGTQGRAQIGLPSDRGVRRHGGGGRRWRRAAARSSAADERAGHCRLDG